MSGDSVSPGSSPCASNGDASSERSTPASMRREQAQLLRRKMIYGLIFLLGMSLIASGLAVFPTYSRGLGLGLVVSGVVVFVASAVLADTCAAQVYGAGQCRPPEYEAVVPDDEDAVLTRNRFGRRDGSYRVPEERQAPFRTDQCKWCSRARGTCQPSEEPADDYWREPIVYPWWTRGEGDGLRSSCHREFVWTRKTAGVHRARSSAGVAFDSTDVDRLPLFPESAAGIGRGSRYVLPPHASCDDSGADPPLVSRFGGKTSCGEAIEVSDRSSRQSPPSYDAVLAGDVPVLAAARARLDHRTL